MEELQNPLPQGWDCKYDRKSGKYYYVNHFTKTTTWEDPRLQQKSRHPAPVEHIIMQHGSPEFRRNYVYPSQTTPIPAFQIPAHCSPKSVPLQDLSHISRSSPRTTRLQDTPLSTAVNTEEAVTKISTMFPTVSDTHIRLLLKKYHNREAVVISALQVEKHPITTPGPFTTPPPARNIQSNNYAHSQMTPPLGIRFYSRGESPILRSGSGGGNETYRNSPKPHSPKLKLRYMKFIFPKADETMILDILSSNDNNIQKVSEILTEMGFEKRDNSKKQSALSKPAPPQVQQIEPEIAPVMKSVADKKIIQSKLEEKYKDIPGQVVTIALESVNFDEKRANQILEIMVKEESDKIDNAVPETQNESAEDTCTDILSGTIPVSQSRQSLKSLLKSEKSDYSMKGSSSFNRIIEEKSDDMFGEYKSSIISQPIGANQYLAKGANQELLLEDYVKWQGPSLYQGPGKGLAKGPNPYLRQGRTYQPCGPNAALRKGPKIGLAKGSIFSQLKGVVGEESRGK